MGKKEKVPKGIGGWLLVVLLLCILSAVSNLNILIPRLISVITQFKIGVLISAALLLVYYIFMGMTILMIFKKKKLAIKGYTYSFITGALFMIWYHLVAWFIYFPDKTVQIAQNFVAVLVSILIMALILLYLLKSKRVKNTLVN
jgi:hypothetical protein